VASSPAAWRRSWWILAALAVAAIARMAWLAEKPLWRDEAWVAVLARDAAGAFELNPRPVPAGFLFLTGVALRVPVLPPEVGLRLLPLAAGLLTVALLPLLARSLGGERGAPTAAAWIAAGLPVLVYYSRELKPYALDGLLAVAVPWLAWRTLGEGATPRPRDVAALSAMLAVAPWVTFGSVFPIAATLGWGGWRAWRSPEARRPWAALALTYALAFGAAYAVVLGQQSTFPRLVRQWQPELAWLHQEGWAPPVVRASGLYARVAFSTAFAGLWPLAAALAALGALTWPASGRGFLLWQVTGTAFLAAVAAVMGRYVVAEGRLLVFAVPALIVLVAGGLAAAARLAARPFGPGRPAWAAAAAAALALAWTVPALAWRVRPYHNDLAQYFRYDILHDVDAVIAEADRRAAAGDPVMTSRYSGEQFRFYAHGRLPQAVVCTRTNCLDEGPPLRAWLDAVNGRGWMILLEEEDRPGRRAAVAQAGLEAREVAAARGARLWEIRRLQAVAGAGR
jgi:hypothetical protein